MSTKLTGNGIWEASRMMLPEHKETIINRRKEYNRKTKPILDEYEMERIGNRLYQAMENRDLITLKLFDPFGNIELLGTIVDIDLIQQKIRLLIDDTCKKWIKVSDILSVQ